MSAPFTFTRRPRRNRMFTSARFGRGGRLSGMNPMLNLSRRLGRATRLAGARSRTTTGTRTQGNVSGIGVTTQRDSKFIYAKRRMPSGRRRNWRRFSRKVHAVAEKDMGSRTVVRNHLLNATNSTDGRQTIAALYLYGQRGVTNVADDLFVLSGLENVGNPTADAGTTIDSSTKIIFKSAVMDVTIKNASAVRDSLNPAILIPNGELKMEVDVYEISVRESTEETGATYTNLESLFANNNTNTKPIGGGAGVELDLFLRGVTPFDLTYALSRWGIKIWKKTKYLIPNGDVITYQMRDPKRRVAQLKDIGGKDGFNRRGWTRALLCIGKLVPGYTLGTEENQYVERLLFGYTRKYLYKIEGVNEDRTRYV